MIDDLTALRLQLDWGADEAIGEVVIDRLSSSSSRAAPAPAPVQPAPFRSPSSPTRPPMPRAETLDQLAAELAAFDGCKLRLTATTTVRPDGPAAARIVLIGDAPDGEDDRSGRAFSGAGGALLDRVMASAGLGRADMLLTTLVPWRPPGGRPPTESEIQACLPFVHRLLAIVRPGRLVLLGALTLKALSGGMETMRRKRASWIDVNVPLVDTTMPTLALPPLDQWLSSPIAKQRLWSDLIALQKATTTS